MKGSTFCVVTVVVLTLLATESWGQQTHDERIAHWARMLASESKEERLNAIKEHYGHKLTGDEPTCGDVFAALVAALNDPDPSIRAVAPRTLRFVSESIQKSRKAISTIRIGSYN